MTVRDLAPTLRAARDGVEQSGRLRTLLAAGRQLVIEGRVEEVAVNLGREFTSPRLYPVIEPGRPVYSWDDDAPRSTGPSAVKVDPLPFDVGGVCHRTISGDRTWGWSGRSLVLLDRDASAIEEIHRFPTEITTVHATIRGALLVAQRGSVHMSLDGGGHFGEVLRLSHEWSKVRSGGLAEDAQGRLVLGEYGNARRPNGRWISTALIHRSDDDGASWRRSGFVIRSGVNKHIHVVAVCPFTGTFFVTAGDNHKWVWSSSPIDSENCPLVAWKRNGSAPWKLGGYTAVAFTPTATYWGTDYWMGTNFVVVDFRRTGVQRRWMLASPLRRNPIPAMAVVETQRGNHILVSSANKFSSRGASGLIALDESAMRWSTLLLDARGATGGIAMTQCSAESKSSWAHLRLRGRSFAVTEFA